jgi:hypothetical protein
LQERLGELNDLAVARVRIGEWFDRSPQPLDESESAVLQQKLSARHEGRLQEFAAWSTDPLQTLAAGLAPPTESTPSQPAEPNSDANAVPTADLVD